MAVVLARLRAEGRSRWRAWTGLAILAGLVGGTAVAALAGARRTETAYPRFLRDTNGFHVLFTNGATTADNVNRQFDIADVRRLPQVTDAVVAKNYFPTGTTPAGRSFDTSDVVALSDPHGRFGRDLNRAHVLRGRMPEAPDELAVSFLAARDLAVDVGDSLSLALAGPEAVAAGPAAGPPPSAFRIVGVVAIQGGFPPLTGGLPPLVLLAPSYGRVHPDAFEVFAVRLQRGRQDAAAFNEELNRLSPDEQVVATDEGELSSVVQRGLGVQATALRLLAAVAAVVGLLLGGQAFARQAALGADDHPVLLALGTTRRQLRAVALVRAVPVASTAAVVALVTAVALSAWTPLGVARQAELDPGVSVNAAYLGLGMVAVFLLVAALATVPPWWAARHATGDGSTSGRRTPSRVAEALSAARFPAPAVSGVRMALEQGGGRTAVPVRSTIISATLGLATIAGVLCFSASLGRLFDDPRLYGWNWDVQVGDAFAPALGDDVERLLSDEAVRAAAVGTIFRVNVDGLRVDALAVETVRGSLGPVVVDGRAPAGPGEILMGTRTLRELGAGVGSTVTVSRGDRAAEMRVVGRGVFSEFSGASRLGEGAAVTLDGVRRVAPGAAPDLVLLDVDSTSQGRDLVTRIRETKPANVYVPTMPSDLADLERVGGLPWIVAAILTVMAVATLAHTLLTSLRRRRRDLAVLKVLGFARGQVSATVAWQSSVIAAIAVLGGLPLGIAAGRWSWHLFADRLGVPPEPATPLLALALLVPGAVLLANLVAAVPARLAAATPATTVLRTE